jgi:hypothetical protein
VEIEERVGGKEGVGMGEKIGGLALGASVIVVECRGILQGIVGRGREEVGGSRGTATPVECGVTLPECAVQILPGFQEEWEQGCSTKARGSKEDGVEIVEVDKHMVNKDNKNRQDNKDNRDKDKGWGLPDEGGELGGERGMGEEEKGRETEGESEIEGAREESEGREQQRERSTPQVRGRVRRGGLGRSERRVEVREISGWVRGKGTAQWGTRRGRRRDTVERVAMSDLPGRNTMGVEQRRGEKYMGKVMDRLGTLNWEEWERTGAPKWMVDGLREGFWWEVQPGLKRRKFPKAQMTEEQMGVCGQSVGRMEGSRGVRELRSEVCVWDESCKKEGAKEMEVMYQQQASKQKGIQMEGQIQKDRDSQRANEDVWVGDSMGFREWVIARNVQGMDGSRVERRSAEVCQDAIWFHQCPRSLHTPDKGDLEAFERDRDCSNFLDRQWSYPSQNKRGVTVHQGSYS